MPNTMSAKKALRQSDRKRAHNNFWKKRIRDVVKTINKQLDSTGADLAIIKKDESTLYKVVDKAARNNVIHKNKAKRIKSRISKKISAHDQGTASKKAKSTTKANS